MNSMDQELRTSHPVVGSQLSAVKQVSQWARENDFTIFLDGDGSEWEVNLAASEVAHPADHRGLLWEITIKLVTTIDAMSLMSIGALGAKKDARLLRLLGTDKIPLTMAPWTATASSDDDVRRKVVDALPRVRRDVASANFLGLKRSAAGRWIDHRMRFGGVD